MTTRRIRKEVDEALLAFVDRRRPELLAISPDLVPLLDALDALLAGGKRLRPQFCYWGWRSAGGGEAPGIVTAAASLELLQASALIHDDVMDSSDTRRGQPSAHRRFEELHRRDGLLGAPEPFGLGAAILLGDLCLSWSGEMYESSALDPDRLARGRAVYDLMRTEVMCGQYLDVLEGARRGGTVETALRVVEYKSAKYTIERPLHLGAALAGAPPEVIETLSAYGRPLGIAFQLRDDVLGVFGDPAETGKPAGDDLREGKRTVLVALTAERAGPEQAELLERHLGDPGLDAEGVDRLRTIIEETGGLAACEEMIDRYAAEAAAALADAPLAAVAVGALEELAVAATARRA
ncbi:geranylgeranyl pyrophosphate synthase [Actinomadura sp. NBRC 104425]|uniref:polyprenyl synthetase family protein n=1 Tax=Actinomadura sp. NBRC 104425 TaxID=3032204 RepID=UPI0024A392C6|nr:polyprenyl synthetase family protein [Actinomadura sp. NBRC 104425]GLZ10512.1 geranylgeranyl pyrophosphate synthase [Actinomadura sp. NBRC 104425]